MTAPVDGQVDVVGTVLGSVTDYGPQLLLIGGAGLAVGAVMLGIRRGFSFFKGLAGGGGGADADDWRGGGDGVDHGSYREWHYR